MNNLLAFCPMPWLSFLTQFEITDRLLVKHHCSRPGLQARAPGLQIGEFGMWSLLKMANKVPYPPHALTPSPPTQKALRSGDAIITHHVPIQMESNQYLYSYMPTTIPVCNLIPVQVAMATKADRFRDGLWKLINTQQLILVISKDQWYWVMPGVGILVFLYSHTWAW